MHQADSDIRKRLLAARLPAMPQILLKLIAQCQTAEVGMAELAALVAKDPGMTGKILGVANSSAYHRSNGRIGLEPALATLGTDMIKTLVISESVYQVFSNFSNSHTADLRRFWQHSLSAAVMAQEIATRMRYPHVEEAYLAGLLHDVGRLALLAAAPEEYAANFLAQDDEVLCAVEQRTLQITHAEAGAWLAERWNLDSFLADSVLYHHEPAARLEAAHPLIRIVLLAHLLASRAQDDPSVMAAGVLCGIEAAELAQICAGAGAHVKEAADYLGIDLRGAGDLPQPSAREPQAPPRDTVQGQLAEEVRDLMLSAEVCRPLAGLRDEAGLLEAVARSARLLFDFEDVVILKSDAAGQALVGVAAGPARRRLAEFSIALGSGGVLAQAALQRRAAFIGGDGNPLGIAEQQLLRLLGTQALVCLPLCLGQRCLGLVIGGAAAWQLPVLQRRAGFLRSFGEQAAAALDAARDENREAAQRVATLAQEYHETTRRVAHEVNNPLSIIKNYLGVLGGKLEKQQPVVAEMSILHEEIDRVGQIIRELAEVRPAAAGGGADINRVVRDVARLFRHAEFVPDAVRIVTQTQDLPSHIEANADTLKQVLVNLVKNAIEALPGGGEIRIENGGELNLDGRLYSELCVRDNGAGIAPEVLSRLFSPVQSTKGGAHQGLGLSIVHGLVKRAEGLITCRSNSKGTAFEILFPIRQCTGPAATGADSP